MPHKDSRNTGNRMFLSLRTKFMLGLTLLALLLILVLSFISSITYRSELEGAVRRDRVSCGEDRC